MTVKFKPEFLNQVLQGVPGVPGVERDQFGRARMTFDCITLQIKDGLVTVDFSLDGKAMATLTDLARFNPGDAITLRGIRGSMGISLIN